MHRGKESTSCAQMLCVRDGTHMSDVFPFFSSISDMLIPTAVADKHGRDRLEVSVGRCVHAVRPCQKTAIREGLAVKQLLFWGILQRWIFVGYILEKIAYPLLPPICQDRMEFKGCSIVSIQLQNIYLINQFYWDFLLFYKRHQSTVEKIALRRHQKQSQMQLIIGPMGCHLNFKVQPIYKVVL